MNYLLDTHALLWLLDDELVIPNNTLIQLKNSTNQLYVSTASIWEISIKRSLGKLLINRSTQAIIDELPNLIITLLLILPSHIIAVESLPFHHKDPFDRIIIAQALTENCIVVTKDANFPVVYKSYTMELICKTMLHQFDFLVIGSGIAGLSYATKLAKLFEALQQAIRIGVITKVQADETNTKYAQGGIAAVWSEDDSFEKHIEDTMIAGDFLSDRHIVEIVVREAPGRIQELINYGTRFDKEHGGTDYDLAKEGGHSDFRILHFKDITGAEIERALLEKANSLKSIEIFTHFYAVELITRHQLGETVHRYDTG